MVKASASKKLTVSPFDLGKGYERHNVIDRALSAYLDSARQGNAAAKSRLSHFASSGNLTAQFYLGLAFESEKNWQQAKDCYQKAAVKQHAPSMHQLGRLYELSRVSPNSSVVVIAKDLDKAFGWHRKAAGLSYSPALKTLLIESLKKPEAAFQLAQMHEQGEGGFTKNLKKAFKHYRYAMQHNHVEAYVKAAQLYEKLEKTALALNAYFSAGLRGSTIAKQTLTKWALSESIPATFCLSVIYEKETNWQQAENYYQQAIAKNHAPSIYRLGQVYQTKQRLIDLVKAYGLYRQAAKNYPKALSRLTSEAITQGEAAFQLAKMHEVGEAGLTKESQQAFNYYALAMCHHHKEAEQCLRAQATSGNPQAQYALGYGYYKQKGKTMVAVMWCMRAAEKNYAPALTYLIETLFSQAINLTIAKIYAEGNGVLKNIARAVKFYDKACHQGSVEAAFYLGGVYQAGYLSVEKNLEKAFDYSLLAVKRGKQEALPLLEQLGQSVDAGRQLKLSEVYRTVPNKDDNKSRKWHLKAQSSKTSMSASEASKSSLLAHQKQHSTSLFFQGPIASQVQSNSSCDESCNDAEEFFKKIFLKKTK